MSSLRERRLGRMPSAGQVLTGTISTGPGGASAAGGKGGGPLALKSPLAQVKTFASSLPTSSPATARPLAPALHGELDQDQPITANTNAIPTHAAGPSAIGTASTVPAPNFNLFRSASVYSTDSDASDLTFLSDDADTLSAESSSPPLAPFSGLNLGEISGLSTPRAETPTTPRGIKPGQGYFDAWAPQPQVPGSGVNAGPAAGQASEALAVPIRVSSLPVLQPKAEVRRDEEDGEATPKKSFVVRSRPTLPIEPMAPLVSARQQEEAYTAAPSSGEAMPTTGRSLAETHGQVSKLVQGVAPDAHAGTVTTHLPTRQSISGEDWESIHGEQGSEWGDDVSPGVEGGVEAGPGSPVSSHSMVQGAERSEPDQEEGSGPRPTAWLVQNPSTQTTQTQASRKTKRNIIIPRRAAPPPPPGPGTPQNATDTLESLTSPGVGPGLGSRLTRRPSAETAMSSLSGTSAASSSSSGSGSGSSSRQALQPRWPNETESYAYNSNNVFDPARLPDGSSSSGKDKGKGVLRNPNLSIHTDHANQTSRPGSANSGDARYAHGSYPHNTNGRSSALPSPDMRYNGSKTPSMDSLRGGPDALLSKGLEARNRGDLAKAAWYYKQSADAGHSTGRMYWGLSLKHGWGVARDDNKAFQELQQACDDALAEQGLGGGADRRESIVQPGPRKAMSVAVKKYGLMQQKELSMGIAEMANCFLNGTGVKKSPEAAMSYLRFAADMGDIAAQEQLGFLFSKGAQGVKKDMHEAARWYRMAGSTNTFGLAWVWKDKYNS